jgi:hypothetical protein
MAMNQRSFQALLKSHESQLWSNRTIADSKEKCRFIPIFKINSNDRIDHTYGIIDQGYWAQGLGDRKRVSSIGKYMGFLPILDFSRTKIIEKIERGLTEASLPGPVLNTFPFDQIVRGAFSHWKISVERWIDEGYPLDETLCDIYEQNKKVIEFRHHRETKIFEAQPVGCDQ